MPHWLIQTGALGVFVVALLDSSIIPLPIPGSTDLLILLLVAHQANPWLLLLAAVSGSVIGGYLTWGAGKKGGEALLEKYVPARVLSPIKRWMKNGGIASIVIAALLPPPIPLLPFLLAAGALGMSRKKFVLSFAFARMARYGAVTWLAVRYGRPIIHRWEQYLAGWSDVVLWSFIALLAGGALFGFWKYRHEQNKSRTEENAAHASG
ncbi:YqaA family protein [Acidipila rosea]|uniref:Membrane protein YqaA with SNARE-associated domain n=1 Tax=Acidipila rosea TaxID=768535 RepID=A0A4R1L6S7_9BACT|nr:VTT domain-containing protein [Acidipila rosea]MBW4043583.1 membrane-associated protein [Acidobacteriota bacterium]TCK73882.1 membrane protein YqaA with SNARE-associated domain [Acidipila rosea]